MPLRGGMWLPFLEKFQNENFQVEADAFRKICDPAAHK